MRVGVGVCGEGAVAYSQCFLPQEVVRGRSTHHGGHVKDISSGESWGRDGECQPSSI